MCAAEALRHITPSQSLSRRVSAKPTAASSESCVRARERCRCSASTKACAAAHRREPGALREVGDRAVHLREAPLLPAQEEELDGRRLQGGG